MSSVNPELERTLARIDGRAWGIATGLVFGLGLFAATIFLVLKGGAVVGPHLQLLGMFFPGYRVSVAGSLLGFVYAFVFGYALGRLLGVVYNAIAHPRH